MTTFCQNLFVQNLTIDDMNVCLEPSRIRRGGLAGRLGSN